MSDDFNIDNEGSGFAIDEADDLESLLSTAENAAIDDEDTSRFFDPKFTGDLHDTEDKEPVKTPTVESPDESLLEPEQAEIDSEVITPVDDVLSKYEAAVDEPIVSEVESEIEPDVSTVVPEPEQTVTEVTEIEPADEPWKKETPPASTSRIKIPTEADDLSRVSTIIKIVDAYRKLTEEEKTVSGQFITGGEEIYEEHVYVVKVLNVDRMLVKTMTALSQAKAKEPVERAFFIIDLDDDLFYSLGQLVSVFTGEEFERRDGRTQYARNIVHSIDGLDTKAMSFVKATESVLTCIEAA